MAAFVLDTYQERKWGFIGEFVARRLFGISPWAHINSVFVSSTHAKASDLVHDGRDTRAPFKTLKKALDTLAALGITDGVLVHLAPGHVETVSAAAGDTAVDGLLVDVSNTQIIGHGRGTDMPKIVFDTVTGASMTISGQGCTMRGVLLQCDIDSLAIPLLVSGGGCEIDRCRFEDDEAAKNCLNWVKVTGDDFHFHHNKAVQAAGAGAAKFLLLDGSDRALVEENWLVGDYSACNILTANGPLELDIRSNRLHNDNAVDCNINTDAAAAGAITDNRCYIATNAQITWIIDNSSDIWLGENYGVNLVGETGKLIGTASG